MVARFAFHGSRGVRQERGVGRESSERGELRENGIAVLESECDLRVEVTESVQEARGGEAEVLGGVLKDGRGDTAKEIAYAQRTSEVGRDTLGIGGDLVKELLAGIDAGTGDVMEDFRTARCSESDF